MQKQKISKGDFGYLKHLKIVNLIKVIVSVAVVLIVLVTGIIINGTRNNICTVMAIVLVLPAAKMIVGYVILLPHQSTDKKLYDEVTAAAGPLVTCFDCVFSNSKSPIGTQAVVINENSVCVFTYEEKADKKLFETSLKEFLKNDKLSANITLYKDEKAFLNRVKTMAANFDSSDKQNTDKMTWICNCVKSMCM